MYDPDLRPPQPEVDSGVDPGGPCGRLPVPAPDEADDGEDVGPRVFALRNVLLEQTEAQARETGYSLDGLCTMVAGDPSECSPPSTTADIPLDGIEGIDNQFGLHFYENVDTTIQLSSLPAIVDNYQTDPETGARLKFQEVARMAQDSGKGTLLMLVKGWNGNPTDARMTVTIGQASDGVPCSMKDQVHFATTGELADELVLDSDPTMAAPDPVWDGSEETCWWLRSDTFVSGNPANPAKIFDDAAYTNENRSVVSLPDGREILFFAGPAGARVILTGGIAAATIADGGDSLTDVVVAGRWAKTDLIATGPHVGVCDESTEQGLLTAVINENADVRRTKPAEPDLSLECDALSMGVTFEAGVKGQLVTEADGTTPALGPSPPLPNPCESAM